MTWLGKILPKEQQFIPFMKDQATRLVQATEALRERLGDGRQSNDGLGEIRKTSDDTTDRALSAVRETFVTPFARVDIKWLVAGMNAAVRETDRSLRALARLRPEDIEPGMIALAEIAIESARLIERAMPLLEDINKNAVAIIDLCGQVSQCREKSVTTRDDAFQQLMDKNADQPVRLIAVDSIYERLENVVERIGAVADHVHDIVIDRV